MLKLHPDNPSDDHPDNPGKRPKISDDMPLQIIDTPPTELEIPTDHIYEITNGIGDDKFDQNPPMDEEIREYYRRIYQIVPKKS